MATVKYSMATKVASAPTMTNRMTPNHFMDGDTTQLVAGVLGNKDFVAVSGRPGTVCGGWGPEG